MNIEQLKAYLAALKEQGFRIDGGVQTVMQLIQLAEQEAAKIAAAAEEVKD